MDGPLPTTVELQGEDLLCHLPEAHDLVVELPLAVLASFVVEIFAGECTLTFAMLMDSLPCIRPWDSLVGERFDVMKNGEILIRLSAARIITYAALATPCQSQSWGRLPSLRSWQSPLGRPVLKHPQRELVQRGNSLALFSAELAEVLTNAGGYVTIENPCRSWLWWHPAVRRLVFRKEFAFTKFRQNSFGACVAKPTCLLHSMPLMHKLAQMEPKARKATVVLRGQVLWENQVVWRTALASPYPPVLAKAWSTLVSESLALRQQALDTGNPVPHAAWDFASGFPLVVPKRFQNLLPPRYRVDLAASRWPTSPSTSTSSCALRRWPGSSTSTRNQALACMSVSSSFNLKTSEQCASLFSSCAPLTSTDSGQLGAALCALPGLEDFQDSFSCLDDELSKEEEYFEEAAVPWDPYVPYGGGQPRGLSTAEQIHWMATIDHPDLLESSQLDADLQEAMAFELECGAAAVDQFRAERLRDLLILAERLEPDRQAWVRAAPPVLRPLVARVHGPLFELLLKSIDHGDQYMVQCLQTGFPFAGQLPLCKVAVRPGLPKPVGRMSVSDLRAKRSDFNKLVVSNLRPSQWSADVIAETRKTYSSVPCAARGCSMR